MSIYVHSLNNVDLFSSLFSLQLKVGFNIPRLCSEIEEVRGITLQISCIYSKNLGVTHVHFSEYN